MRRWGAVRFAVFFVAGMALVLLLEDDFRRLSQLADMVPIDYVFLAIWGGLFGLVLWGLFLLLSHACRRLGRALRQ